MSEEQESQEARNERVRKQDQEYLNALREVIETHAGRKVLWRLLSRAGVFRGTYTQDSGQAAFNEGRRNEGLSLLLDLEKADKGALLRLIRENDING